MAGFDYGDAERFFWDYMAGNIQARGRATSYQDAAETYIEARGLPQSVFPELVLYFDDIDSGDD
jgi:hypothetical protein